MSFGIIRFVHDGSCIIAILLNAVLIAFIFRKTPEHLRNYSIVLFKFAFIESSTAVACLFIFNRIMSTDEYDLNAITGPCRLIDSTHLCFLAYAYMMHGHSHYCVLLAFGFSYRYYVVKHSSPSSTRLILALALAYLPTALIYTFFASVPILDTPTLVAVMSGAYPEYDHASRGTTEMMIGTKMSAPIQAGIAWTKGIVLPSYAIIIISSLLFHNFLKANSEMSVSCKKMQREIMKALIVQSMLPTLYFVAAGFHTAHDNGLVPEWEEAGHLPPTIGSLTLAASPICTFLFIRPYRLAIRSMFVSKGSAKIVHSSVHKMSGPSSILTL